jgi:hypothetical protein
MGEVTIDFVARDQPHGGWALIFVEQGPWPEEQIHLKLRDLQERLYTCLDAILDGDVTTKFPESRGLPLMIQVDAYDISNAALPEFFERFSTSALSAPDYASAMAEQRFYPRIEFKLELGGTMPSNKSLERTRER